MLNKSFSRRTLFTGATTLLSSLLLPRVEGLADTFSLVPIGVETALADDDSAGARVMVVSRTQVGVVAYDMTDPSCKTPLPGAHVKLISRSKGGISVEGTADYEGKIIFDVLDLAEDPDAEMLAFNGTLEVTCDGYRDVCIPLTRVFAHAGVVAPTYPLGDQPYLRTLCMDEWDVQYTEATFMTGQYNEDDHEVVAEVKLPRADRVADATLTVTDANGGEHTVDGEIAVQDDTTVSLRFVAKFLRRSDEICIDEGCTAKVGFRLASDLATTYTTDLHVSTKPVPIEDERKGDAIVVPAIVPQGFAKPIVLPKSLIWPLGGASFSIWTPTLPILYDFSPLGYGLFGAELDVTWQRKDDGEKASWQRVPRSSVADQWKALGENNEKAIQNFLAADAFPIGNSIPCATSELTKKFAIAVRAQGYGSLDYDWGKKYWTGNMSALLGADVNLCWTWQMSLMGFPFFFQVNPFGRLYGAMRRGLYMDHFFEPEFTNDHMTFGFNLAVGLGVTAGIGVSGGWATASVTGSGYLSFLLNIGKDDPDARLRFIIGAGASLVATFQIGICKATFQLAHGDWPQIFDSKYDALMASADENGVIDLSSVEGQEALSDVLKERLGELGLSNGMDLGAGELPSFADLKAHARIVTNEELLGSREFEPVCTLKADAAPVSVVNEKPFVDPESEGEFGPTVVVPKGALAAGLGDSVEASLAANADDYLPEYTYVGKKSLFAAPAPGISGIVDDRRGGVIPSVDNAIFTDVNSNPNMRLLCVQPTGRKALFRLASVDVGGGRARTRVVYHLLENGAWSEPHVVNFDPQVEGVSRDDLYDYEFDVAQAEGKDGASYICLVVTSGTLPDGDDTPFEKAVQARYISLVSLYDSYAAVDPLRTDPTMTCALKGANERYTLMNPRIEGFTDKFSVGGSNNFCVMGTYQARGLDADEGFSRQGAGVAFFARLEWDDLYTQRVFRVDYNTFATGSKAADDYQTFPVKIDDGDYSWAAGSVANDRRMTFAGVRDGSLEIGKMDALYKDNDSSKFQNFRSSTGFVSYGNCADQPRVCRIYPWGDDGELLFTALTKDENDNDVSSLYHMSFDAAGSGDYSVDKISDDGSPANFVADAGRQFLFYAQNTEGKTGQTFNDDGTVDTDADVVESKHHIMAVADVDGAFTKPFVFCEVPHHIDGLVATLVDGEYVSFLANCITDIDKSLADIYDVRVPLLKCLTPVALVMSDSFAYCGEDCAFVVHARNDGNLVAKAFTCTLFDADTDEYVDEARIELDDPILPGDVRECDVSFAIPEDWHDAKNVYVKFSDIDAVVPTALGDASVSEYHKPADECPTLGFSTEA